MASSIFIFPFGGTVTGDTTFTGNVTVTVNGSLISAGRVFLADGSAASPSLTFTSDTSNDLGMFFVGQNQGGFASNGGEAFGWGIGSIRLPAATSLVWTSGAISAGSDTILVRDAANTLALKNGTTAQGQRWYGYSSGARSAYGTLQCATAAVSVSGATTATGNIIPAGATVHEVATTTTTTITGATGYTVGDGADVDRWGDITGTAVGTASGSPNYTADPRWWTTAARAITLTAKTSNFTGGVVQVMVFYTASAGA